MKPALHLLPSPPQSAPVTRSPMIAWLIALREVERRDDAVYRAQIAVIDCRLGDTDELMRKLEERTEAESMFRRALVRERAARLVARGERVVKVVAND